MHRYLAGGNTTCIAYGTEIDCSLERSPDFEKDFPFLKCQYLLSVSRVIKDNKIRELCEYIAPRRSVQYVVISNFSISAYGQWFYSSSFEELEQISFTSNLEAYRPCDTYTWQSVVSACEKVIFPR